MNSGALKSWIASNVVPSRDVWQFLLSSVDDPAPLEEMKKASKWKRANKARSNAGDALHQVDVADRSATLKPTSSTDVLIRRTFVTDESVELDVEVVVWTDSNDLEVVAWALVID